VKKPDRCKKAVRLVVMAGSSSTSRILCLTVMVLFGQFAERNNSFVPELILPEVKGELELSKPVFASDFDRLVN
jgi:hypothetical protein